MTTKRTPKAGHDFGHGDPARPRSYQIKAFDFTSKNDGTKTPGYADNPMCDPSEINEEASSDLDKLHDMLTRIGITDDEIKGGLSLTQKGYHKVAAALGTTVESVQSLVNSLVKMLNGEHSEPILSEKTVTIAPQKMSMMDEINSNEVLELLLKINQLGTTVILATHAADLVNKINKRVITIEGGKITFEQEQGKYKL